MIPEQIGIVKLEDLPEKEIFISFKKDSNKELKEKIKKYKILKLSKKLDINSKAIYNWINNNSSIRLDYIIKILNYFNLSFEEIKEDILYIKGKRNEKINKIIFNFVRKEGVRLIASIMGDGCLTEDYEVYYSNTNKNLIEGFLKDSREIFGNIHINIRKSGNITTVSLPNLCGKILVKIGLKKGKKIITNNHVPSFIFNLEKEIIGEFISQIIDDEGSINLKSRYLKIKFAVLSSKGDCNLAKDIVLLIQKLGVNSHLYNFEKRVYNKEERTNWQIQVSSIQELKKLYQFLNLRHEKKDKRFRFLFNTIKQVQYPKSRCTSIYLNLMKYLQQTEGYFNSYNISKETGRAIGSCRNTLLRFKKQGLIKCIEDHKTGRFPSYSKFEVVRW